jgi:hypothetical protein
MGIHCDCPPQRCRGVEQVWIDAVTSSRDAAIRERDLLLREVEKLTRELQEVRRVKAA